MAIFGSQFKYMSHLYTPTELYLSPASGTWIFGGDHAQVTEKIHLEIPSHVHISQVQILSVPASDGVFHPFYGMIRHHAHFKTHWAGKSQGSARHLGHELRVGHLNLFGPKQVSQLDLVQFMVTPYQCSDHVTIWFEDKCFDELAGWNG